MPFEKQIKEAAERIWREMKQRQDVYLTVVDFSPQSLWVVERVFESPRQREGGGLLCFSEDAQSPIGKIRRDDRALDLGAYIGEVVRRYFAQKSFTWGGGPHLVEIELGATNVQPPQGPLLPMKLIWEQMENYTAGSIVEWGKAAGLPVGPRPKIHQASFGTTRHN